MRRPDAPVGDEGLVIYVLVFTARFGVPQTPLPCGARGFCSPGGSRAGSAPRTPSLGILVPLPPSHRWSSEPSDLTRL